MLDNIARLRKVASAHKEDSYVLQIFLVGLYAEWEGAIKWEIDRLVEKCNQHNTTRFKMERRYFKTDNRTLNNEQFKQLWQTIFGDGKPPIALVKESFFKQRNSYAHGVFNKYQLEYSQYEEYCQQVIQTLDIFRDEIYHYIENEKYLENDTH